MARGGGFFSRIGNAVKAVRSFFTGASEEPPSRATPREGRDRQRARERDPYLREWDRAHHGQRGGYLNHREIIDDMAATYNLDEAEKQEMWRDYNHYIVSNHYRRNDIRNPFWQKWGIDPDQDFDWHAWREAMGYPHGGRK